MKKDAPSSVHSEICQLHKKCAYLERKLTRLREQQTKQENLDDINRHILRLANERLQQFHDQAQQENISKSDFLANMSHEIRTPLNIILGMANLLADTNLDTTQAQYLNSLRVTGRQLTEILNNVLEFSRIDAGKISFEPEPFSLEKIINKLEASILPLCIQKQIQYSVQYSPFLIMERIGDQLKIYQILLNLINNAVKFTATGGAIVLEVKDDKEIPGNLILSVGDTGIGISEEHQKIIFERFTQVHDLFARPNSGTGLGLAICQKLTSVMGGELKVQSKLGVGSVFSCTLPLAPVSPSERNMVRLEAHHIPPGSFPKLNILAVDDVKENLEVIKVYLKDYPVRIQIAGDGEEALRYLGKNQFDLILLDIRMPVMDGVTAAREIRRMEQQGEIRPNIILAITAHAFQEQKKKIIEAGFDGVLSKPFFRRDLIQTIYRFASMNRVPLQMEKLGNKAIGFCLEREKSEEIPPTLKEIIPSLLQTITDDLSSMKLFWENGEYENLYAKAHSLKGVAGMFGFQELGSLIFDLSQTIKAGNQIVAQELFGALDCYLNRLR